MHVKMPACNAMPEMVFEGDWAGTLNARHFSSETE